MRLRLTAVLLFSLVQVALSQISVSVETSYSDFKMAGLKAYQQFVVEQSSIPIFTVNQFPAYFGFGVSATVPVSTRTFVGVHSGFTSTGARSEIQDYSGFIRYDQLAKCIWFGPQFQFKLNRSDLWSVYASFRGSVIYSFLDQNYSYVVATSSFYSKRSLNSWNYGLRPEFSLKKSWGNVFGTFSVGYEFQFYGKLNDSSNSNLFLKDYYSKPIYAEWDGLRVSIGVGYQFLKK